MDNLSIEGTIEERNTRKMRNKGVNMVSVEYSEAIVEVLDILKHSDDDIFNSIPKKLIDFWERNKSNTYKANLDHTKLLKDMDLKEKTKAILSLLYLNYICDEKEKERITDILIKNEEKYQQELLEKYNPDDIFKNKQVHENKNLVQEQLPIEVNKEGIFKRIIKFIKNIFVKDS